MKEVSQAIERERQAFNKVKTLLGDSVRVFARPKGFNQSFPDFGFRLQINGKNVDLHFEYKSDHHAQMGSMRDWIFNGARFLAPNATLEKQQLLYIMNNEPHVIEAAHKLLHSFRKHADRRISSIHSGMLGVEKNLDQRRAKLRKFIENVPNYSIATIRSNELGTQVINFYTRKFHENIKPLADCSYLFFIIDDTLYYVTSHGNVDPETEAILADKLKAKSFIPVSNMGAQLEVRYQPGGLNNRRVRIDVMAQFRLTGKPSNGWLI